MEVSSNKSSRSNKLCIKNNFRMCYNYIKKNKYHRGSEFVDTRIVILENNQCPGIRICEVWLRNVYGQSQASRWTQMKDTVCPGSFSTHISNPDIVHWRHYTLTDWSSTMDYNIQNLAYPVSACAYFLCAFLCEHYMHECACPSDCLCVSARSQFKIHAAMEAKMKK